jgi:hypothetical protein
MPVEGRFAGGGDTKTFRLDAIAGDKVFIDRQVYGWHADRVTWRLIDPFGRQVLGPTNFDDIDNLTLAFTGAYTLVAEHRVWDGIASDFRFTVHTIADQAAVPITLGGANPAPGPFADAGKIGGGLTFSGVEFIEGASNASTNLTGDFTIESWVKIDRFTNSWTPIIQKGDRQGAGRTYSLWVQNNGSIFYSTTDASGQMARQTGGGVVQVGDWIHLAVVGDRTAGTMKLYANGVEIDSGTIRKTPGVSNSEPLLVGRSLAEETSYQMLQGSLDEVRLWSVARTAEQIQSGMTTAPAAGTNGLTVALPAGGAALPNGIELKTLNPGGVTGRIGMPGETDRYSFTLNQQTVALFDSLTWRSDIRWSLSGPDGVIIDNRRFDDSDSSENNPLLSLRPGDYVLTVDGVGEATGYYNSG